jgi:hypothetical protein
MKPQARRDEPYQRLFRIERNACEITVALGISLALMPPNAQPVGLVPGASRVPDFISGWRHVQSERTNSSNRMACFGACGLNLSARHKPALKVPRIGRIHFLHPTVRLADLEKFDG